MATPGQTLPDSLRFTWKGWKTSSWGVLDPGQSEIPISANPFPSAGEIGTRDVACAKLADRWQVHANGAALRENAASFEQLVNSWTIRFGSQIHGQVRIDSVSSRTIVPP